MITEPLNKFGRTRDELPTAGELLAAINKPLPFSQEAEREVVAAWMRYPDLLEDPGVGPDAFVDDAIQVIASEILHLHAAKRPLFSDGQFDIYLFQNHLVNKGLFEHVRMEMAELSGRYPLPGHYRHHRKIVLDCFRRRQMIHVLALGIERVQCFGRIEGEGLEELAGEIHQSLSEVEIDDEGADLHARPTKEIIAQLIEQMEERAKNPGAIPGVSTGFGALDQLIGGLQPGRQVTILAETSNGKSLLGRQIIEEACEKDHVGVIYTYEMTDYEEIGRIICSQGRLASDKVMLGKLKDDETGAFIRATKTIGEWDISIVDVSGKFIEDIHRDIKRRSRRLKPGQHLIAMIDYPQIAKTRKRCSNREQEIAHITGTTKQCAKTAVRTTIILPSQVNKDGDARESMAIEQDCDVKIQIINPNAKKDGKGAKVRPWNDEEAEADPIQAARRLLYLGKNRGGKKNVSVKVIMKGEIYRFEQEY